MVQLYADGVLVYDPYLEGSELQALTANVSADKAGTAEIVMPAGHPAYDSFVGFRTVVEIYRDNELLFRGRALYPTDDFFGSRTITCEGERCFLNDAVIQPYLYQTEPGVIFTDLIRQYNEQVEGFKQFVVGTITAKDPNDYIRLESESATPISEAIDKMVERVGGYLTFTTDSAGRRTINWLATLDRQCSQVIEFGENLLDYSRSEAGNELATVIYPYGAQDETTGKRVTIEAVNGGKLYVQDDAAVARYGSIAKIVNWDDVTLAKNLLRKAKQYLETSKLIVSTLELSAVDLSAIDKSIDELRVGDNVRVLSAPHGVNEVFLLRERTYNLLDPSQDKVVLGKELITLTGSTAINERNTATKLSETGQSVTNTYNIYSSGGSSSGGGGGGGGGSGMYGFAIDSNGHLICSYEGDPPALAINSEGHLIYTYTLGG